LPVLYFWKQYHKRIGASQRFLVGELEVPSYESLGKTVLAIVQRKVSLVFWSRGCKDNFYEEKQERCLGSDIGRLVRERRRWQV